MDEIGKIVKNNFKIYADTLEASGHEIKAEQLLVAIDRELREVSNRFERLVIKKFVAIVAREIELLTKYEDENLLTPYGQAWNDGYNKALKDAVIELKHNASKFTL